MSAYPPIKVKAKFHCVSVNANENSTEVRLSAVTGIGDDNKDFTDTTPSGELILGILAGAPASNFFKPGNDYYLEFEQAPDQPKSAE